MNRFPFCRILYKHKIMNKPLIQKLQNLPLEISIGIDLTSYLENEFREYLTLVAENEKAEKQIPMLVHWHENDTNFVQVASESIEEAIKEFLKGKHGQAFARLKEGITSDTSITASLKEYSKIEMGTSFYRARIVDDHHLRPRSEFFHIPFNLREKVDNQRFSIQGFPCLYLGTSVYGCWLEMGCPPLEKFQVCRLEADSDLAIFDYSIKDVQKEYDEVYWPVLNFIRIWPFVAASMIKVKNRDAKFKPEYIIPQLLMQYIMEEDLWDGLMYSSTHASPQAHSAGSKLQNLVLPAWAEEGDIDPETNLSGPLATKFKITEPISWPGLQMARGLDNRIYNESEHIEFNKRMPEFRLLPSGTQSYHHSAFGQMEEYLDKLPSHPVLN